MRPIGLVAGEYIERVSRRSEVQPPVGYDRVAFTMTVSEGSRREAGRFIFFAIAQL